MKLKVIGLAVLSATASMAFASTASATTFEVGGVVQTTDVTIKATLFSGGSSLWTDTSTFTANTCTTSNVDWSNSTRTTGTTVEGPISALSWSNCLEGNPTVDANGTLSVERIGTTTNGTVRSTGTKVTVPSFFGTLTCTTSGTDIGTLTGVPSGTGVLDINAVLSCTVIGTAKWSGTYVVTSPVGLGVVG